MSNFIRIIKIIGRAIRRAACAVGRFFKLAVKKIGKAFKTNKQKKIIKKSEKKIGVLYSKIGKSYFEAHENDPEPLLEELCADVTGNNAAIADARDNIESFKQAYAAAKSEAREKARARRASDKEKAKADKASVKSVPVEETPAAEAIAQDEPVFYAAPAAAPVADPEPIAEPVPAAEAAPIIEPAPVITPEPAVEPAPVITPEPAVEPAPVIVPAEEPAAASEEPAPAI